LRTATPNAFVAETVLDAYTDVVHRSLFGLMPHVNVHATRVRPAIHRVPFGPVMQAALEMSPEQEPDSRRAGPARAALLGAARGVLVARGFHGTRVDDIVEAAGVSHGAFYRYFKSKDDIAHLLAAQAMRTVSATFTGMPDLGEDSPATRKVLRRWLRAYHEAQSHETAMIRIWVDAALQDEALRADSAAVLHWGRRRMVRVLAPRAFGDPETEAIVLLALLDTFGGRESDARTVDAAAQVIERGFLGR
jgi:AcrR family transcriptional regulator